MTGLDLRSIRDHADRGGGSFEPNYFIDHDAPLLFREIDQLRKRLALWERVEQNISVIAGNPSFVKRNATWASGYQTAMQDLLRTIVRLEDELGIERPIDNG